MQTKRYPQIEAIGERCCGCAACAAICPKECISLEADPCGFWYSSVDATTCIGCLKCDAVCPVLAEHRESKPNSVMWGTAKKEDLLMRSSSGGLFGLLAEEVLTMGGVVYGAAFSSSLKEVRHVGIDSLDALDSVMRSKYVQSYLGQKIFWSIEDDLRNGKRVLVCATACQIDGIRRVLSLSEVDTERLVLVDVICHGVPSPKLWSLWVEFLESECGSRLDEVSFRDKADGWRDLCVAYAFEKGVERVSYRDDWYMKAFLHNASLRPSCFSCPSKLSCGSDVTLGDFWGAERLDAPVDLKGGVSAVLINTERGRDAVSQVRGHLSSGSARFDDVVAGNSALISCVKPFWDYRRFMEHLAAAADASELEKRFTFKSPRVRKALRKAASLIRRLGQRG